MKANQFQIAAMVFLAMSSATVAMAVTKNWTGGNGNWNVGANWNGGTVPLATDQVNIVFADGIARTVTYDVNAPTLGPLTIDLTGAGVTTNTLSIAANSLTASGLMTVGNSGRGSFNQIGGTTTISGTNSLFLGNNAGSVGSYFLSNTGSLAVTGNENIGLSGMGSFTQSAGSNTLTLDMVLGFTPAALGTYTMSGGTFSTGGSQYIGYSATGNGGQSGGTFNQTGGTNTVASNVNLGYNTGSTGAYTISGGILSAGSNIVVGSFGTGTLSIQGNGSVSTNGLSINGTSAVNVNGGTLRFNTIGGTGGLNRLNFTAGKVQLAGSRSLSTDATITTLFGAEPTIPAGKELGVEGFVSLNQNFAEVTVSGGRLTSSDFIADATVGGALVINNGGTVTTTSDASIAPNSNSDAAVLLSGAGSTWTVGNRLTVGDTVGGGFGTVVVGEQSLLHIGNQLSIGNNGRVRLEGGTLRFRTATGLTGIDFRFGTIQLAGDQFIATTGLASAFLDAQYALKTGKGLTIEGAATLLTTVTLDGGTFSAGQIVNASLLDRRRGTLNLTNQTVTIGTGGLLGSTLDLNDDMTVNVTLGITNQGVVTGGGQIGGTFSNAATGQLRAEPGRSLKLTGPNNTNAGRINLLGGQVEFTQNLTNNVGGLISGNGSILTSGLTNQGTMNFAGTANVLGDVTNSVGGKIISSGGGATIFYDDVLNNGEIRTSTNGFTVFFGSVSGAGSFTNTGTVNFEGEVTPGNSPAAVNFGGGVVFGPDSTLEVEIGGTAPGTEYDQINVAGDLTLDGTLEISLINGFTPTAGQTFEFLNWGSVAGAFSFIQLPALPGLTWDTSQLATGKLTVALPGDFNLDGTVDAADYIVWRKTGINSQQGYDNWRSHFGQPPGSAAGGSATSAVPEPATLVLLVFAAAGWCLRRRRSA